MCRRLLLFKLDRWLDSSRPVAEVRFLHANDRPGWTCFWRGPQWFRQASRSRLGAFPAGLRASRIGRGTVIWPLVAMVDSDSLKGLLNMLRHLQVIKGAPTPPPKQIVVGSIKTIRPTRAGLLETLAPPLGELVKKG